MTDRKFRIKDIDCSVIVEYSTRKNLLEYIDEYIFNLKEGYDMSDYCFDILYKDGSFDSIDENYDDHKIRRINIASIVYNNPCTSVVYGNFEMNEFGVVTCAFEEKIDQTNIEELK